MKNNSTRSRTLRGALLIAGAAAAGVLYAQALSLRPGSYEFVFTSKMDLPPEILAKLPPGYADQMGKPYTEQMCITASDLDKVSRQLRSKQQPDDANCTMSDQSVVGTQVKFTQNCTHAVSHFEGTIGSDSIDGTMVSTDKQGKVTVHIKAHRLGDCTK